MVLAKFKFGDLNDQHHGHTCVKSKLVILNLVTFEKFAKSTSSPKFPAIRVQLYMWYKYCMHMDCCSYTCMAYLYPTHLINEIGNEKCKGEHTGDECTCPDVGGLATGPLLDDSCCSWTPVPVSTLNNAGGKSSIVD